MPRRPPLPVVLAVASLHRGLSVSACRADLPNDRCLEDPTGAWQPADGPAHGMDRPFVGTAGRSRAALSDLPLLSLPLNGDKTRAGHLLSACAGTVAQLEGSFPSLSLVCVDHPRPSLFSPWPL